MTDHERRRTRLMDRIGADGFLTINLEGSDAVSLFYLTGFTGEGALLLSRDETVLLTDSRYTEQAGREVPQLETYETKKGYLDEVTAAINARSIGRLAIGAKRISHYLVEQLQKKVETKIVALNDPVADLRITKEQKEVEKIEAATRLTEAALSELIDEMKIGMSEQELALRLEFIIRGKGAEGVSFDLIVAAGENSALPHYRPGKRRIKQGDLLLLDIGARLDGYCSDMTRVFAVGDPPNQAQEIYSLVLQANRIGIAAVRPGLSGVEVDAAAREVIAAAGHGDHFGHGLGHGVGLEVHEPPRLSPLSKDELKPGMVVTVEPGVYIPGFGGVRIEDLIVVTEDGYRTITTYPRDRLISVP